MSEGGASGWDGGGIFGLIDGSFGWWVFFFGDNAVNWFWHYSLLSYGIYIINVTFSIHFKEAALMPAPPPQLKINHINYIKQWLFWPGYGACRGLSTSRCWSSRPGSASGSTKVNVNSASGGECWWRFIVFQGLSWLHFCWLTSLVFLLLSSDIKTLSSFCSLSPKSRGHF